MSLFDPEEDENKDYLAELTGPGGKFDRTKYASEVDMYKALAKGKVFGDRAIEHKNKEFDELREDFLKERAGNIAQAKFEELKLSLEKNNDSAINPNAGSVEKPIEPTNIEDIVAKKLAELEARKQEKMNLDIVETRLRERFGQNSKSILKDKMNTLGITEEDIKFLAKRSPEAVLNALGVNQQQGTYQNDLPRSNIRSDNFVPTTEIRDAIYYEDLRKKSPKEYFSPKISTQRLKDMEHPDFVKRYNAPR